MPTPSNGKNTANETQAQAGQANAGVSMNASLPALPASLQMDPKRLLWLGGLVAVGALGVLEWPVVAAVGVGSYVAEQLAKSDARQAQGSQNNRTA
jgi:hypothetical protein